MSEQSDTLRTDAAIHVMKFVGCPDFEYVDVIVARDLERALATATRERDEARAEVKRLLGVLLGHVPHTYEGNCPDSHDGTQRDPHCHACQILTATEAP